MSLFSSLFAGQQQQPQQHAQGGLFSSQNQFATSTAAAVVAPAEAAPASGGSGKKRRKQQAATEAAPAAASAEQGVARSKKQRKGEQQQQQPAVDASGKAAAAAAAAAQPAAEQQQGKKQKKVKQGAAAAGTAEAPQQQQERQQPAVKQKPLAGAATGKGAAKDGKDADDARLPRTVFVGNLPATVQRKALARLFADCGAVESVRLRSLPLKAPETGSGGKVSKMPRRGAIASGAIDADHSAHAYVVFAEEAAVEAALALNMKEVCAVLVQGGGSGCLAVPGGRLSTHPPPTHLPLHASHLP
jgi:nucleolar protein 12